MKNRPTNPSHFIAMIAALAMFGLNPIWAAEPSAASPTPSKEMREKMAQVHEKMATCLRSDKEFSVCRTEMQASCQSMMGKQGCPMMGMHMNAGKMGGPMPKHPTDSNKK